jgi:predicted HTH domain antitoxin
MTPVQFHCDGPSNPNRTQTASNHLPVGELTSPTKLVQCLHDGDGGTNTVRLAEADQLGPARRRESNMKSIAIEYPEAWTTVGGSSAESFEHEARMAAAVKLVEIGRLTSGQAAQLAGLPRVAFLLACPQWGVPAVAWDADEVAAEFKPLAS